MTPNFDDDAAQRLLASAEAVLAAEDERIDGEEWAEVVRLAEEVAEANRAVWQRTREIEALRGGPVSAASREMLHWLERDIAAFAELLERGGR